MDFDEMMYHAKCGDNDSIEKLIKMYSPLLYRKSMVDGKFDEDLYQELNLTFLRCIQKFQIDK